MIAFDSKKQGAKAPGIETVLIVDCARGPDCAVSRRGSGADRVPHGGGSMSRHSSPVWILAGVIAIACGSVALAADATPVTPQPAQTKVKTSKERLGDKASDEQRVDDCKVPPERRSRTRPANCQSNN
jgi:hypothetical protein